MKPHSFQSARKLDRIQRALCTPVEKPSAHRLCTVVRAQKVASQKRGAGQEGLQKSKGDRPEEDLYPKFESEKDDAELLPKRAPGTFPNVHVTGQVQGAVSKLQSFAAEPASSAAPAEAAEFDPLRDGPLRYLGYANEVGEAFAAWLPFWGVPFSYAVAIGYVLTDTADKGSKAYRTSKLELSGNQGLSPKVDVPRLVSLLALERTLDTVVWQLLASVACPGYTIHTIVALVHSAMKPLEGTSQVQQAAAGAAGSLHLLPADVVTLLDKSFPTLVGLAAIPFIVHPIDNAIHALLNASMRPAMRKLVCGAGQGELAGLQMCGCEDCLPASRGSEGSKNGSS